MHCGHKSPISARGAARVTRVLAKRGQRQCGLRAAIGLCSMLAVGGCVVPSATAHLPFAVGRPAPADAPPGTCWDLTILPARIETVTEQVLLSPAVYGADGQMLAPAVFATETRQEITRPREEKFFETPCPTEMNFEFISSLQRALAARGLYAGPITGLLSRDTRNAVRAYQVPLGIDSASLSLQAARALGLSAVAH